MTIAYQAPGIPFAVHISASGEIIRAALDAERALEFKLQDNRLSLVKDYNGPERERMHLHAFEYIFSHASALAALNASDLNAPLSDDLARALLPEKNGERWLDREAFFQYAPLWHRRQAPAFQPERWTETNGRAHPERSFVEPGLLYRRYLPSIGRTLTLELFDRSLHLDIYHEWHNQPRVSVFWEMAFTKDKLEEYQIKMESDPHQRPVIASLDGQPIGYFEIYWTPEDRLGPYYEYDPFDRGYHFLIGDVSALGKGTPDFIQSTVHFIFLDDPRTRRVMGEPRHDNIKLLRYLEKIPGWKKLKEFDFPHKRAALLQITREDFFRGGSL